MMRYDSAKKVFEYKADETIPVMTVAEDNIEPMMASIKAGGGEKMVELIEFLVKNAKSKPGLWVEASSKDVSKGQATL
jgi:hypothetical protein